MGKSRKVDTSRLFFFLVLAFKNHLGYGNILLLFNKNSVCVSRQGIVV